VHPETITKQTPTDTPLMTLSTGQCVHDPERSFRGVVFDLDGTLVDSLKTHQHSLRAAAVAAGRPEPSAARIFMAQRATDLDTVRALVGDDGLDPAWGAYERAFRELVAAGAVRPVAGAATILGRLRAASIAIGVCTGRSRELAAALLVATGLDISLTVAREDAVAPKPAPEGLLRTLTTLGLAADETLFVGDGPADAQQGGAAGVRTVLVDMAALAEYLWPVGAGPTLPPAPPTPAGPVGR
jgi:pyrophosphatase PpaX